MKKIRRLIGMTIIALLIIGCITGCVGSKSGKRTNENRVRPQNISIVIGRHDNFPAVTLNDKKVYDQVYSAVESYGSVSSVIIDGDPYVSCNYTISRPKAKVDKQKKSQIDKNNTERILNEVQTYSGKTSEIDTLAGISLAADILNGLGQDSEKSMIIYDSGLSTTSLLNFAAENIIDQNSDILVKQLKEAHAIPDMSGISSVTWIGLGQTCGEQGKLTKSYKYKLQKIWEAILKAAGAKSVAIDPTPIANQVSTEELPVCSIVPVIAEEIDITDTLEDNEIPELVKWDSNSKVHFLPDKAEFTSPSEATKQLDPIAEYLITNPMPIYILGMTATVPGGDTGIELSKARSEACKNILIKMGVKESLITCVGLGQTDNFLRVPDTDENGMQTDDAQKNRAVFIMKADSKMINQILK